MSHDAGLSGFEDKAASLHFGSQMPVLGPMWLNADGRLLPALIDSHKAAFVVPAQTLSLRIVSKPWSPCERDANSMDRRPLGILIETLSIDNLLGDVKVVALDDPNLFAGFHPVEQAGQNPFRWTNGDACLSSYLWRFCSGPFVLRLVGSFDVAPAAKLDS